MATKPATRTADTSATKTTNKATSSSDKPEIKLPPAIDCTQIKVGDVIVTVNYLKVEQVNNNGEMLVLRDLHRPMGPIAITGKELVQACQSADQYVSEEKVSRTVCAETLMRSFNKPIAVCFVKKDGTERILRGRMLQPEPVFGRTHCEDLETTDAHRLRLVTHETLKWLVVDGVKYSVK